MMYFACTLYLELTVCTYIHMYEKLLSFLNNFQKKIFFKGKIPLNRFKSYIVWVRRLHEQFKKQSALNH